MKLSCLLLVLAVFCKEAASITVMSIDLGNEWMKIAIVKPGVPMEIVLNKETKRKTELAVAMKDGERLFGSSAVAQRVRFPKNTYIYFLDLLAKKMDNPLVMKYKERFPFYDLIEDPETGYVQFRHDAENNIIYSPEELLAMTLNYSKSLAEDYAQQSVDFSIITVPSYYNQAERMMILYAAKLGGLPSPQVMDVNTAAALNYGVFRRNDINATASYIMFFDMGATSTTAIVVAYQVVKVNGIADPQLTVKGVGFDRTLGGLEMEFRLREHLIKLFNEKKKTKSDVRQSPKAMAKLLKEARRLKLVLSANAEHHARVESLIDDEDFRAKVTREEFENLCTDLWPRIAVPINEALSSAGLTMDLISKLILVGGGTRVPKVQEVLLKESGKSALGKSLNADEAPALGASYEVAARSKAFRVKTFHIKSGSVYPIDIEFERVTAHENGTQTVKNVRKTLFQRNNPYPQRKVITFNRFYSDFGFSVNYGDLKFLTEEQLKVFGSKNISKVKLHGVDAAYEKYGKNNVTESKGIKGHFRMDENGILNLEEVESVFESNATTTEEENATEETSTFEKLKNRFSNLFGTGDEKAEEKETTTTTTEKEEKVEEKPQQEEKKEEPEQKQTNKEEFGDGDKEGKTDKKEDEMPESNNSKAAAEEDKKEDEKSDKSKSDEKPIEKSEEKNKTETAETQKGKKIKMSAPLNVTLTRLDFIEVSEDVHEKSKAKLQELSARDALKIAREEAMNALEAYIYDKQDKLYQEEYEKAMSETEQEEVTKALREASDWMFDLEEDASPEVYKEKLKDLRTLARPWLLRVKERQEVEPLLKDMESLFNYTVYLMGAIDTLPEDEQIYSEVERNLLKKTFNDTVTWKNETLKEQQTLLASNPAADNIMTPNDLKSKMGELSREVQYLLNKAKTTKPKKKVKEEETNATKTDKGKGNDTHTIEETDAGGEENGTKTEDQQPGEGKNSADKEGEETLDAKTEDKNLDAKTEEENLDAKTEEENLDAKTEEETLDAKTEEENLDAKTEEENLDAKTEEETPRLGETETAEETATTSPPTVPPTTTTETTTDEAEITAKQDDDESKEEL